MRLRKTKYIFTTQRLESTVVCLSPWDWVIFDHPSFAGKFYYSRTRLITIKNILPQNGCPLKVAALANAASRDQKTQLRSWPFGWALEPAFGRIASCYSYRTTSCRLQTEKKKKTKKKYETIQKWEKKKKSKNGLNAHQSRRSSERPNDDERIYSAFI